MLTDVPRLQPLKPVLSVPRQPEVNRQAMRLLQRLRANDLLVPEHRSRTKVDSIAFTVHRRAYETRG